MSEARVPVPHDEGDLIDGCDVDFDQDPTSDEDAPYVALFAGVPPDQVEEHAAKLREAFTQ